MALRRDAAQNSPNTCCVFALKYCFFRFDRHLFRSKKSSFWEIFSVNSFVHNKSLGLFPRFSIFFLVFLPLEALRCAGVRFSFPTSVLLRTLG